MSCSVRGSPSFMAFKSMPLNSAIGSQPAGTSSSQLMTRKPPTMTGAAFAAGLAAAAGAGGAGCVCAQGACRQHVNTTLVNRRGSNFRFISFSA